MPLGKIGKIAYRASPNFSQRLVSEEGLVAADEHVVKGGQAHEVVVVDDLARVVHVEEGALTVVDVQRQAAQMLRLERGDDSLGVDQAAARRVDQHGTGLHLGQRLAVDDVLRLVRQRAVQADDVALHQEGVEVRVCPPAVLKLLVLEGVEGDHPAPKPHHYPGQGNSNLAGPDQADCLSM